MANRIVFSALGGFAFADLAAKMECRNGVGHLNRYAHFSRSLLAMVDMDLGFRSRTDVGARRQRAVGVTAMVKRSLYD